MKRAKLFLVLGLLIAVILSLSSCIRIPVMLFFVQESNREPGKPIMVNVEPFNFTPTSNYVWKLEKEQEGWVNITSQNLKQKENNTAIVYLPTIPETGQVRITVRANYADGYVEQTRYISYGPKTPVLVEVFEEFGTTFSQPSAWFGSYNFSNSRLPTFVRYREGFLESAVGFDPFAQRLLFGVAPGSKSEIYDWGEVFFQAWTRLPSNTYSSGQMTTILNTEPVASDWKIRVQPTTFIEWRATGWKVSVENIDRSKDDLWLFRARRSDNLATHLVRINNYYTASSDEFEGEAVGTFVDFTFNESSIVGPTKHLWDEDYYFGIIAVERTGATSDFGEQVTIVALKGSTMVLFPDKNW
ncbi:MULTISPECIES: hypothetical protein [unclassified Mesotoga]|uniref:hypothetical protein n=1 Tax=unclassified Mesotoga TaxID=1184398 RepID=UPI000DA64D76|nr:MULTISPECIES: hypothetical protein [unclassified Mesotoga]PZC52918.1 hypothetical protein LH53_02055 [Mesotoga sp. TolDC]